MNALATALVAFQKDAPTLHEDATNPHFKNRYLSLEGLMRQVLPVLTKHGLALMQFPTVVDGQPGLRTKLLHESGEFEEDTMQLALAKSTPQEQGSGLTYARRYAAMAILGLVADEDDDGNSASRPVNGSAGAASGASSPPQPGASSPSTPAPAGTPLPFGKYKGRSLEDLVAAGDKEKGYVEWLASGAYEPKTEGQQAIKNAAYALTNSAEAEFAAAFPSDDDIPF
jgi:hypothetical protein